MTNGSSNVPVAIESVQAGTLECLRAAKRWMLWKSVPNPDPAKKPDKVPHYVNGQPRGATDTPADWMQLASYQDAVATLNAAPGMYAGLAFALGPDGSGWHWQGIDLDDVPQNQLSELANTLPGYVERSPSGNGCHAIGYGTPFAALGSNGTGIEAYAGGRYFTFTGDTIRDGALTDLAPVVQGRLAPMHGIQRPTTRATGTVYVDPTTISDLRSALFSMRADDYELWRTCGMALHCLGDVGRGLFMEWSATSEKFNPLDAARKWDRDFANVHSLTYLTVFHEAVKRGWLNPRSKAAQIEKPVQVFNNAYPSAPPLSLMSEHDLDSAAPTEWIVHGVIPENSIGTLFGPSGTFKSFIALDVLAHIANGWRWMGKHVKRAPCVYVPFEGKGGIPKRARAWRDAMYMRRVRIESDENAPLGFRMMLPEKRDSTGLHFVMDPINLRDAADRRRLVEALRAAGLAGCVLCIDTLAQASAGIDENSSAMSEILAAFQELQRELSCSVLVVHHTGKNVELGMRGWSGIRGAMDFAIESLRPDETKAEGVIWLDKMKDDEDGKELSSFWMQRVSLEYDEFGDLITSLVVQPPLDATNMPDVERGNSHDSTQDDADDEFVWTWVAQEVERGEYPTGRSLEGQREQQMASARALTQKRLRDAIHRLRAASRLVNAPDKAPSGNVYMRAVDALAG